MHEGSAFYMSQSHGKGQPKTTDEKFDAIMRQLTHIPDPTNFPDLSPLKELVELAPDIKEIVREKKEQEAFNKRAAKIGRWLVVIASGFVALIGAVVAVSKLIVSMGR